MSILTPPHLLDWAATKIKTWVAREGEGYTFVLNYRGHPVAEIREDGNGADVNIEWIGLRWNGIPRDTSKEKKPISAAQIAKSQAGYAAWKALLESLPPEDFGGKPLSVSAGMALGSLLDVTKMLKKLPKKLIFEVGGQQYALNGPYNEANKAYVMKKHPAAVLLNEVWGIGL